MALSAGVLSARNCKYSELLKIFLITDKSGHRLGFNLKITAASPVFFWKLFLIKKKRNEISFVFPATIYL